MTPFAILCIISAVSAYLLGGINGAIILLHPTSSTNAAILGDLIKEWKKLGYRFGDIRDIAI